MITDFRKAVDVVRHDPVEHGQCGHIQFTGRLNVVVTQTLSQHMKGYHGVEAEVERQVRVHMHRILYGEALDILPKLLDAVLHLSADCSRYSPWELRARELLALLNERLRYHESAQQRVSGGGRGRKETPVDLVKELKADPTGRSFVPVKAEPMQPERETASGAAADTDAAV